MRGSRRGHPRGSIGDTSNQMAGTSPFAGDDSFALSENPVSAAISARCADDGVSGRVVGCWRRSSCSGSISAGPAGTGCFRLSASFASPMRSRSDRTAARRPDARPFPGCFEYALRPHQPRAHHLLAKPLHHLRPHHNIGDAGFVLQRHEDDAAGAARTLSHQHHAGATDVLPVIGVGNRRTGMTRSFANIGRRNSIGWPFNDNRMV
jgi:hypothetical protein